MNPCDGLIVINGGAAALIVGAGGALMGLVTWGIREAIKGRDNHIQYAQTVNSDLTEINAGALGIAGGAVKKVGSERRETGRRGT